MTITSTAADGGNQRKSLRDFRESTATLFAKNNTPFKVTCHTDKVSFELEPAGHDDSIRILPKECLDEPGFQRLWMRGKVTISDDEAMEREITLLMGGQVETRPAAVTVMMNDGTEKVITPTVTESGNSRDMVFATDTDPASRTFGQVNAQPKCVIGGEPVFIAQTLLDGGEPPLCEAHADLKHQIVSTPQPDGTWHHQPAVVTPSRQAV